MSAQFQRTIGVCTLACVAVQILKEFVGAYGPLAIMLEDLHHFDSISWGFLTTVAEKMSDQVLVVTTMRPNDGVLSIASRHEEGKLQPQCLERQLSPGIRNQFQRLRTPFCIRQLIFPRFGSHFANFDNSFPTIQKPIRQGSGTPFAPPCPAPAHSWFCSLKLHMTALCSANQTC